MIYVVTINNKQYEVEVEKGKANIVKTTAVTTPEIPVQPVSQPQAAPAAPAPASAPVPAGAETVKAPMPGTILDIKVKPGASVKKGETLLILEAMKMENEVVAPADCVVAQVSVSKGASVNTGDVLVIIK